MAQVIKRRDIRARIVTVDDSRQIQIDNPAQHVRVAIESAMVKSGIEDGKAFMAGLTATALKAVSLEGKTDKEIELSISKSIADTINETNAA